MFSKPKDRVRPLSSAIRSSNPAMLTALLLTLSLLVCLPDSSQAQTVTYIGKTSNKAQNLSGTLTATFVSNGVVDFVLTNSATYTGLTNRQNVLSGFFFNYSTRPTATLTIPVANVKTTLTDASDTVLLNNGSAASSQAVDGAFVFKDVRNISGAKFAFGVNSSGYSNTANPNYSFSGFSRGGGGDDYTLIGTNSTGVTGGGSYEVIHNSVTIRVSGLTGLTATNQINGVAFAFASGAISDTSSSINGQYLTADGILQPVPTTPAAVSLGIGCCVGMLGMIARGRGINRLDSKKQRRPVAREASPMC